MRNVQEYQYPRSKEDNADENDVERAYQRRLREMERAGRDWQARRPRSSSRSTGAYFHSGSGSSTGSDSGSFGGSSSDSGSGGGGGGAW